MTEVTMMDVFKAKTKWELIRYRDYDIDRITLVGNLEKFITECLREEGIRNNNKIRKHFARKKYTECILTECKEILWSKEMEWVQKIWG